MAEIKRIRKAQIPMVERWKTDKFNWGIKLSPEKLKKLKECGSKLMEIHEREKQKNGGSKDNNSK